MSSLGSEALQIIINPSVDATIGDTHVELSCSYTRDGGDYIYYVQMTARNKTSEEYIPIATFYPQETNRNAILTGEYLTGRVSLTNPMVDSDKAILTFNEIQCVDDTDYICSVSYDNNGHMYEIDTDSTSITITSK